MTVVDERTDPETTGSEAEGATDEELERASSLTGWLARVPHWAWLAGVLVVALLVRTVNLNAVGYNSDEAVYSGQAAALAGNPLYVHLFPVFRAHPLLVPILLSPFYGSGSPDLPGRIIEALLGVATVLVVYLIGRDLFGWKTGILAAAILALMPYHVGVTRQVLLDGPETFCVTLAFWLFVRFVRSRSLEWLLASAGVLGLGVLTKETSIVLALPIVVFCIVSPKIVRPVRTTALFLLVVGAVSVTFPLVVSLGGKKSTGQSYLAWQLARSSSHAAFYYFTVVPAAVGWLVVAAAAACWLFRSNWTWKVLLLSCWLLVPLAAFEIYPLKGYQYLLPVAPALALLAARGLTSWHLPARWKLGSGRAARPVVAAVVLASLLVGTWSTVFPSPTASIQAGGGGIPGGRSAGKWVGANLIPGTELLTLGPSMANILSYYGHRPAQGLSVSADPLHRNPSYTPVYNADLSIKQGQFTYLVWDAYSAYRSPSSAARLMKLVAKHDGTPVLTQRVDGKPVIVIYQVHP